MTRRLGPATAAAFTVLAVVLGVAGPAAADPAGPTDYRTTIESVEPAVAGLTVRMIGGDSFLELVAPHGAEVIVIGYQGEPYLRFSADGTVDENAVSPTTFANLDRYNSDEIPAQYSADLDPVWEQVASDGSCAWHDHRTHWMLRSPKPGSERGDTILEAVVPLQVDGREVLVSVRSVWLDEPSWWPVVLGGLAGAALAIALGLALARGAVIALIVLATGALAVGLGQVWSLPPETGPSPLLWILPVATVALVGASFALAVPPLRAAMVLLSCVVLVWWALGRLDGLRSAIIPTDVPFALDRFVTTSALVGSVASAAVVLWRLRARP